MVKVRIEGERNMIEKLKRVFAKRFGSTEGAREFFAPGRVNLIGEHTDYNGGNVFPCALDFGTYAVARRREDRIVKLYSVNFEELGVMEFSVDDLENKREHDWANYPKGVLDIFRRSGYSIENGFEVAYGGNIPNGAGLSSSASIEVVTSVILKELFELENTMIDAVKMSQRAENEFIGVNCGIMDQFAIGMGRRDNAILLDCNTLEYTYSELKLEDEVVVIANTNKRRGLADSKYNERRGECKRALEKLQEKIEIGALGELSIEEFESNKEVIGNETDTRRAKHAVYENQRTLKAVEALKKGDVEKFGKLMNESHVSLRDDYEVTGRELDTLVEAAWRHEGTVGSRMTGAGFGGCTVSIVRKDRVADFIERVGTEYRERTGLNADFYVANIGDGARELV